MEDPHEEKFNSPEKAPAPASPLKQIRTFQGDVATALEQQKESLVSIQRTEAAKRGKIVSSEPRTRSRPLLFFFSGFILIGLGALGSWITYNEFSRKTAPPIVLVPENRFIIPENSIDIDLSNSTKEILIKKVSETTLNISKNELLHLVFKRGGGSEASLLTTTEFFQTLGSRAPGRLTRSLNPLFMFGALGNNRFIIFKLNSFENTFAGMLSWEENLDEDLGQLFSTAPLLKNKGLESNFKDIISKNKDVRVLFAPIEPDSATTTPVLLYSFFDNRILIITENLETLQTIIDRLTREMLSR